VAFVCNCNYHPTNSESLDVFHLIVMTQESTGRCSNDIGLYDLPNFYRSDTPQQQETQHSEHPMEKNLPNGDTNFSSSSSSSSSSSMAQNCFSFLAFTAGLAAVTCALASMVGTGWVDTWEPIDLPPVQDWPSLFGKTLEVLHPYAPINRTFEREGGTLISSSICLGKFTS